MAGYNVKIIHYLDSHSVRFYSQEITEKLERVEKEKKYLSLEDENPFKYDADRSLLVSKNRTINKIYDLCKSNSWEYFITLTFSQEKVDRYDYNEVSNAMIKWLHSIKNSCSPNLRYIIVPELHKDGAYHFHGLISDIGNMEMIDSTKRTKNNDVIYNIKNYKLGFTTATKVKENNRVSGYITKYITKELCTTTINKKRYWSSKNLNKPYVEKCYMSEEQKKALIDVVGQPDYIKCVQVPDQNLTITYMYY